MNDEYFQLTKCGQSLLQLADELVACVETLLQSNVLVREVGDATLQIINFLSYALSVLCTVCSDRLRVAELGADLRPGGHNLQLQYHHHALPAGRGVAHGLLHLF